MSLSVPVVDLSAYAVGTSQQTDAHDDAVRDLATQLVTSLEKFGIVYLTNHGIPQKQIDVSFKLNEIFFKLPTEEKEKYRRQSDKWSGFNGLHENKFDKDVEGDSSENFTFWKHETEPFPDETTVPNLTQHVQQMTAKLEDLSARLLRLLAIGLNLDDAEFFINHHTFDQSGNFSNQHVNYYPPLRGHKASVGQMRKGEHTDGSTMSLLFHTEVKGLQVKLNDEYLAVPHVPSSVMLVVGDMLQRWTADRLRAPVHRVIMPDETDDNTQARQSVVYFVIPDKDKLVKCLDGSDKYAPVYTLEYNYAKLGAILNIDKSLFVN